MLKPLLSSADDRLIRRLEDGHADSGIAFARAYFDRHPDSEVAFEQIAGGWAIFQGVDSPLTQALAMGMRGALGPEELARLEQFFHSRGAPAVIDVSVMADPSILSLLQEKRPVIREISNVLARRLEAGEDLSAYPSAEIENVSEGDSKEWAHLVIRGFTERDEISAEQIDVVASTPPHLRSYFARAHGRRVAVAGMTVAEGLATFFGDATLRGSRRAGLQLALIAHRLRQAAAAGCDLASASVIPGSASHRNYERAGFQLVYSRIQLAIPIPHQ
ncbi:MAG: acetyltransferase, family [Bryobacterales bacterium]|nr:acetyltransferase, family [Bryobacterales bacterium]